MGEAPSWLTTKQESSPERLLGVDHPHCPERTTRAPPRVNPPLHPCIVSFIGVRGPLLCNTYLDPSNHWYPPPLRVLYPPPYIVFMSTLSATRRPRLRPSTAGRGGGGVVSNGCVYIYLYRSMCVCVSCLLCVCVVVCVCNSLALSR